MQHGLMPSILSKHWLSVKFIGMHSFSEFLFYSITISSAESYICMRESQKPSTKANYIHKKKFQNARIKKIFIYPKVVHVGNLEAGCSFQEKKKTGFLRKRWFSFSTRLPSLFLHCPLSLSLSSFIRKFYVHAGAQFHI